MYYCKLLLLLNRYTLRRFIRQTSATIKAGKSIAKSTNNNNKCLDIKAMSDRVYSGTLEIHPHLQPTLTNAYPTTCRDSLVDRQQDQGVLQGGALCRVAGWGSGGACARNKRKRAEWRGGGG